MGEAVGGGVGDGDEEAPFDEEDREGREGEGGVAAEDEGIGEDVREGDVRFAW